MHDMDIEIDALSHPKGIWTTVRGLRIWYFPYFGSAEPIRGKYRWRVSHNGGTWDVDLNKADTLMFYGATGSLPLALLDECASLGVTVIIQRTHMTAPFIGTGPRFRDRDDLLSAQILARSDAKQSSYLARQLIRHKLLGHAWLHPPSQFSLDTIAKARNCGEIRLAEAQAAKRYWQNFFDSLGVDECRRGEGELQAALDAGCHYLSGILLRWIQAHGFSPAHGFLHAPSSYPALVADLMEPYRYCVDRPVFEWYREHGSVTPAQAVTAIQTFLAQSVLVEPTRQRVYRRTLLAGVVLALRHYLTDEMKRFSPPHEVMRVAGRKQKCSYRLMGEIRT